jgi:spermidine dehydrogenase
MGDVIKPRITITRRDFIGVVGGTIATSVQAPSISFAGMGSAEPGGPAADSSSYPPALTGIRGQTSPAMSAAHRLRDAGMGGFVLPDCRNSGEEYDLVVIGAGMSGLSAAYFFKKRLPDSKILILEGCDDIGGHARRNEFLVDGKLVVGIGGTAAIVLPETYTPEGKELLADIGIDAPRYGAATAKDGEVFDSIQSKTAVFFDRESYGEDVLVDDYPEVLPWIASDTPIPAGSAQWHSFLDRSPLSKRTRIDLRRIVDEPPKELIGKSLQHVDESLKTASYLDYLRKHFDVGPEACVFIQKIIPGFHLNVGAGPDSFSAHLAREAGCPGFEGLDLPPRRMSAIVPNKVLGDYVRLPDGNAGVARLLTRWLIPESLPGHTMEDSLFTPLRYAMLDRPTNSVRIRLNSTAVRVVHKGPISESTEVEICYLQNDEPVQVRAKACVMACFHAVIPYVCPEIPEAQKADLRLAVRKPLVWVTVALKNWRAFAKVRAGLIYCPGSFYEFCWLDLGITLGDSTPSSNPESPAVIYLGLAPNSPGNPARDQFRAGRAFLQGLDRERYEREARSQLRRMLGKSGFVGERDVASITVNRWAHGYACGGNDLFDEPVTGVEPPPWVRARQRIGRISIANSDAAGVSLTQAAFDQADRAVRELISDVLRPQFYYLNPEQG